MQFCKMMRTRIKKNCPQINTSSFRRTFAFNTGLHSSTAKERRWMLCSLFCGPSSLRTAQAVCKELSQRRMAWPGPRLQMKEQTELKRIYCGNPHRGSHQHKVHWEEKRSKGEPIIMIFIAAFSVGKQNFGSVDLALQEAPSGMKLATK